MGLTSQLHQNTIVKETNTLNANNINPGESTTYEQVIPDSMIPAGQSREEARGLMNGVLHPKLNIRIASWNVRTMFESSKQAQITKEMDSYHISILGVSEARWTGNGLKNTDSGHTIIYSGCEDQHMHGVAIIMNKMASKALIEWKPISERMIRARFDSKYCKATIIQVYAPTNEKDDDVKADFYNVLNSEIQKTPKHDMLMVIGDFNAKVGDDRQGFEDAMGHEGIGNRNDNGFRLLECCVNNELVVTGTLFQHKNIHKTTWTSPDGKTKNIIDHILVNRKWIKSIRDTRTFRGADVGSDHNLLICNVKLCLKAVKKQGKSLRKVYNTDKLKDQQTRQEFTIKLKNRFRILEDLNDDDEHVVEKTWYRIKDNYNKTAEEVLGFRKRDRKDWISDQTWQKIEERKKIKSKLNAAKSDRLKDKLKTDYTVKDKDIKKSAKQDKRKYVEDLAEKAQEASVKGDLRKMYKITKQLSGSKQIHSKAVRGKDGTILTAERDVIDRWRKHFEEVLNRPEPELTANPEPGNDLEINTEQPSEIEVRNAIQKLKMNKSPGGDQISAEMLLADLDTAVKVLTNLLGKIWSKEKLPDDWTKGIIIKLPKKGDLSICDNWRGIMLLSIPSKVLSKVLLSRIDVSLDKKLREEQAGFRRGRGCVDQIFTLRNIIETCAEWNTPVHINFVDFQKAFDSIHRNTLWKILRSYGIPIKLVTIISKFYENFEACVAVDNKTTDYFGIGTGVRQGCILSPILFLLVIDWIMKQTNNKPRGLNFGIMGVLEDLDFADDLAILSSSSNHLQTKTDRLVMFAKQVGLFVNVKKTEVMNINKNPSQPIKIGDSQIKEVNKFTYLGSVISNEDGAKADIETRINKARVAFKSLQNIWKSRKYNLKTKLKVYNSNVKTVLLYGSECWRVVQNEITKLNSFHNGCLRKICRVFWPNIISNDNLYTKTKEKDLGTQIRIRRLRWLGHVFRMDTNRNPKKCLRWNPPGKRSRGKPKTTWRRSIEAELKKMGMTWGEAEHLAKDRNTWRNVVAEFAEEARRG